MKNKLAMVVLTAFFIVMFSSCSEDEDIKVPDPTGTYSVSLDPGGIIIYEDFASDAPYTYPGGYTFDKIRLSMFLNGSNLNVSFRTDLGRVDGYYWGNGIGFQSGQICSVGPVEGLGYVDSKPTAGYSSISIIEKGYGYVIRSKKYINDNSNAPYIYYRFFVVDWITNIYGGINAVKIKIQGPY